LGARISGITGLCGNLKGKRAQAIHDYFVQFGVRVEAGDKSLHSLIDANGQRVDQAAAEGDVLAVALQSARVAKAPADDVQNMLNQGRLVQVDPIKPVLKAPGAKRLKVKNDKLASLHQGAIGFTCSTERFKQDSGIPQSAPVDDYMLRDQKNIRMMGQQKYAADLMSGTLTPVQGEKRLREIRDKTMQFAQFMGFDGLRKWPVN
jgi:hypothetical protein